MLYFFPFFGKYFNKPQKTYQFVIKMYIENLNHLECNSCNGAHTAVMTSRFDEVYCNSCGNILL